MSLLQPLFGGPMDWRILVWADGPEAPPQVRFESGRDLVRAFYIAGDLADSRRVRVELWDHEGRLLAAWRRPARLPKTWAEVVDRYGLRR